MGRLRPARGGAERRRCRLRRRRRRRWRWSLSTAIEGLGTSLEEIQEMAREEGEVNIVQWPGYAQLTDEFTAATGCTVNTKDGASSDDMISLIQTGAYDGVSASGNASVRLMTTGEVAPVDTELHPELRGRAGGHQEPGLQQPGRPGVRCSARPRPELPHVPQRHRPRGHDQLERDLGGRRPAGVRGEDLDLRRLDLHRGRCRVSEGDAARSRDRQPVPAQRGAVQRCRRPAEEAGGSAD